MKEMIVCDIEIVTSSSGTRTRYAARGSFFEEGDGFVLCYLQDGRRILLRYGLCFGQECQVFRVNIAVKFISEEQ